MLKIKDFGIRYKEATIFEKANLEVQRGEIAVISGKSGCGKSSLLKSINGILFETDGVQISGDIEFDGESILEKNISNRSRFVSTVFQNPKTQFYCINTTDELAFALENRNIKKDKILETIDEYTTKLNTVHLLDKNIFTLSGGEKQLVAITAVACMDNNIYLFDEPSASLDKQSIELLKNTLLKLKSMGKIIIIAEHRLYYLTDIMSKFVVLHNNNMNVFNVVDSKKSLLEDISDKYELRTLKEIVKKDLSNLEFNTIRLDHGDEEKDKSGLLKCEKFLAYYDKNKILDMSISFQAGINFIIGENGVGKTTFIKKLSGLLNGKGRSFFAGKKIEKNYEYISMVMQDVNYQLFTESVWQEISIASSNDDLKKRVLEELELYDKKDFHPQILSGGEKQRLLIGLAKVSNKPIIILDEPTSGLCRGKMMKIIDYLYEMKSLGKVIIVITHDYELIHKCGGKVYEFVR
ncbi:MULTISPECIES: ATP-binding cassette domain-containing protein [Clostridium]|uniref:ABC transporter ATP-binding protein n=1 Tax=Clostridium cadaveris TaxID=1529 RepID=A0A1I2J432_9CLOT|nr:ABC transporter ATP-binding protein [Clostridium cadaveris]MDU4951533.1 ABC transporter ATP-binding protein [Clostridium sp.]MDM8311351.1 ABC transporter ATP-binding protein [Clostridium cadaveris]MDY4950504.1 ABC transporter ATP-binding protein [Clostridium cadaveris]NME63260.1 ABC transporter ATP-binding protein [Clostridium cadaveris]NWK10202.1 ABC transporter ATP-binding protein [Clostridium cadaveris]